VNLCHFFDFYHPYEKYTPPYRTAQGDPILMEGTVHQLEILIADFSTNRRVFCIKAYWIKHWPPDCQGVLLEKEFTSA
jgi:hypothetical protein